MSQVAKLFVNGRSQAVRLPAAYRFPGNEVFIRQDEVTGDVILSRKPENWDGFIKALKVAATPNDFLGPKDRKQIENDPRDIFADWQE